jgi:hypothetical protein
MHHRTENRLIGWFRKRRKTGRVRSASARLLSLLTGDEVESKVLIEVSRSRKFGRTAA